MFSGQDRSIIQQTSYRQGQLLRNGEDWLMLEFLPQHLRSGLLSLPLVDVFHQDTLVLEAITFTLQVQLMVPETRKGRLYLTIYKYSVVTQANTSAHKSYWISLVSLLSMIWSRMANTALLTSLCVFCLHFCLWQWSQHSFFSFPESDLWKECSEMLSRALKLWDWFKKICS